MIEKQSIPKKMTVPRALKNLVIDSIKRHAWNIGVSQYRGEVFYMEKDDDTDHGQTNAEVVVSRRYLTATFKIYPVVIEKWKNEGADAVERIIAHEVAHLATQHFYDAATARYCDDGEMKDAWETCTEVIGKLSEKLDVEYKRREKRKK